MTRLLIQKRASTGNYWCVCEDGLSQHDKDHLVQKFALTAEDAGLSLDHLVVKYTGFPMPITPKIDPVFQPGDLRPVYDTIDPLKANTEV